MPWWRKPFTLILVPHDESESYSVRIKGITFLVFSVAISLIIGLTAFTVLAGFSQQSTVAPSEDIQHKLTKLREENRRLRQVNQQIDTLHDKLDKSRDLQNTILSLSGLDPVPEESEASADEALKAVENTTEQLQKTQEIVRKQVQKNEKLETVKRFVQKRNRVFQHTPVLWPVDGWLSSSYGVRKDPMGGKGRSFHEGVDLAAWHRSPVRAPADGTVVQSGRNGGYGKTIEIRHEYGYTTLYGHLDERLVQDGESVTKGQLIGRVGSTGHSTGSHLHYEVRINGDAVNPWPYLVQEYESFESVIDREALSHAGN
jgi:murein DD-endopeptidase MepM/ murein hydrolase activator NlpD